MALMTFRNSKIVYYGPHPCDNCGILVAKMGAEWGGTSFTYPEGPVYPNTEWHPHVCDPHQVFAYKGVCARRCVLDAHGGALAARSDAGNYEIREEGDILTPSTSIFMTEWDAWLAAYYHLDRGNLKADDPRVAANRTLGKVPTSR
jgi:hypothetical protein